MISQEKSITIINSNFEFQNGGAAIGIPLLNIKKQRGSDFFERDN